MTVEPIGLAMIAIGIVCLFLDYRAMVIAFIFTTIFGAAAAMFVGAANIQPGHVFLGFATLTVLSRRRETAALIRALHPDRPGFWLAVLVIYGIATAFLFPRLMAGMTDIVPLGSSAYDETDFTVPLGPVSSNLTQSIYMFANLVCFIVFVAFASSPDGFRAVVAGMLVYAIGNVAFAFIDLATYYAGMSGVLDFMRNVRYTLHTETEVAGMKRIVGSFTETSSFARASAGVVGFTGTLWLCGYRPALTGTLTIVSLVLLVFSTSSTGLVVAPLSVALLYLTALTRPRGAPGAGIAAVTVVALPMLVLTVVLAVALSPAITAVIGEYVDMIVLSKADTDSGIERSSWNTAALQNFRDSGGLGVGLGTIRTSSLATALAGGMGIIGIVLYLIFLGSALGFNPGRKGTFETDVRTAARNSCLCLIIGDLLISPNIDQALIFYAITALAAARPARETAAYPTFVPLGARA